MQPTKDLPCPFCGATSPIQGNQEPHIFLFHAGKVSYDIPLPVGTALSAPAAAVAANGSGTLAVEVPEGASEDDCHHNLSLLLVAPDDAAGDDLDGRDPEEERVIVVHVALSASPVRLYLLRPILRSATSALVYRFLLYKGDMARAGTLVPAHRQGRQSDFFGDEINANRLMALSTGSYGMTNKARIENFDSVAAVELATAAVANRVIRKLEQEMPSPSSKWSKSSTSSFSGGGDSKGSNSGGSAPSSTSGPRLAKKTSLRKPLRRTIRDANDKVVKGPLTSAFPTAEAFTTSLKGEQDRCLAKIQRQVTDMVEGDVYKINFCDVMEVAQEAFGRATDVQLHGQRQIHDDSSIKRCNSWDCDVYLEQEADVLDVHANAIPDGKPIKSLATAV